ncbi:MAG: UDP-N-acetylglucosamine 1-carboxyvinyltransferase, partial [Fibrobacter sp.]|nr:UDP-N-acetylglucosamine 1-carboxyvinyltransferase [Fibrobacter sp.]
MSTFIVDGKQKLNGSIKVSGNKNEALPVIAASLLCSEPVELSNLPDIGDVQCMLKISETLGAVTTRLENGALNIDARKITSSTLPIELSSQIRASVLFASSLLARTGKATICQPGGDVIGRRRLDSHFLVFQLLGADLHVEYRKSSEVTQETVYILDAPNGLTAADIHLDEASVTATENAIIAAAGAKGTTIISNAASEPHVQGLCSFLQKLGVIIEGTGSNVLKIHGTQTFSGCSHRIGSDYIEAGSFIGLAAATGSNLTITGVDLRGLRMILFQFERIGVTVETDAANQSIYVPDCQQLKIRKDLGGAIPRIEDSPWPGFPTDLMSIFLVTATQSEGT